MEENALPKHLLKHFLASLAYRTQKALRGAPSDFANFCVVPGVRTPEQLVRHMSGVLSYALSRLTGSDSQIPPPQDFEAEVARFHELLQKLGEQLDRGGAFQKTTPEQLLQGPFADAMTHAGQLAMLRRLAGSPIPPENFHEAAVSTENLSSHQPSPVSPDEVWLDADGKPQPLPKEKPNR